MNPYVTVAQTSLKALLVLTILTGGLYPIIVTASAHLLWPTEAQGSLVRRGGVIVGSRLIGQTMDDPAFFHPRPSAVNPAHPPSGASHWSPTSRDLRQAIDERRRLEGEGAPFDLLTTSASGLDPHISPESAYFQLPRVAAARHLGSEEWLRLACLIKSLTEGPQWGFLGKDRVSVLLLNLRMAEARRILTPKTAEPGTGP